MRSLRRPSGIALLALSAAVPHALGAQASSAPPSAAGAAPTPARVTRAQFARLRWIAGDWRGIGVDGTTQAPFFERYRFVDDSTLLVESLSDSTRRTVSETSRYELRDGRLGNTGAGARWVAVALDSLGVDFAPVARARNTFRWERAARAGARPAAWRATIASIDRTGATVRRHYLMQRLP